MGAYKYLQTMYHKKQSDVVKFLLRLRAWEYRQQSGLVRLSRPSRIDKARRLGYKAKPGFVVYRIRIRRGSRKKPLRKGINAGKPRNAGIHVTNSRSLQAIAEARVGRACGALRVLNSYWVNQDAKYKWYEVILVDPTHIAIQSDPHIKWICSSKHRRREERGLTSAGRKARGLRRRGIGSSKIIGGSRNASWKRRNTLKLRRRR
mmetsp:Transcript_5829/g.8561  ORF Transcript_5829/g.8561 Transcript_5829/m.8561 type:complete len:205 (+) Transcript_5829:52-666(+)